MDKFRAQYALHKKYRHKQTNTSKAKKQVSSGSKESEFYSASSLITESTASNSVDSRERNRQEPLQVVQNEASQRYSESSPQNIDDGNRSKTTKIRGIHAYTLPDIASTTESEKIDVTNDVTIGTNLSREETITLISSDRNDRPFSATCEGTENSNKNLGNDNNTEMAGVSIPSGAHMEQAQTIETHATINMVPTEAQLRWAQFHQKKRALATHMKIARLMQTPLIEEDVDGAQSGDGDSFLENDDDSTSSNSCEDKATNDETKGSKNVTSNYLTNIEQQTYKTQEKKKLSRRRRKKKHYALSRGRKALLRVSARKAEQRRTWVRDHGFAMEPDRGDKEGESMDIQHSSAMYDSGANCPQEILNLNDGNVSMYLSEGEGLIPGDSLFSSTRGKGIIGTTIKGGNSKKGLASAKKKASGARRLKGKRSMVNTADEDEERMKRFEEAYVAMCGIENECAIKDDTNIQKAQKRWTRGSHVPIAISVDGREYHDLQRSPAIKHSPERRKYGAEVIGAEVNGEHPTDRGASWMMHLPKNEKTDHQETQNQRCIGSPDVVATISQRPMPDISPGKKKLMELVDRLQLSPKKEKRNRNGNLLSKDTTMSRFEDSSPTKRKTVVTAMESTSTPTQNDNMREKDAFIGKKVLGLKIETKKIGEMKEKVLSPFRGGVNVKGFRDKILGGTSTAGNKSSQRSGLAKKKENFKRKLNQIVQDTTHNNSGNSIIDTDQNTVLSTDDVNEESRLTKMIGSLMLSPTILTKRLHQAIQAVETCNWDQVSYLVNANPWLCEMTDIHTNQCLLHKVAFYGAGHNGGIPSPKELNEEIVRTNQAIIHKFDNEGNLPLHMAADAGNFDMVELLSGLFPGGSSVRNDNGFLPLHLAVMSCSSCKDPLVSPAFLVKTILDLFPSGLAVADNNDNLALHLATEYLTEDVGAEIIYILVGEAERQGQNLKLSSGMRKLKEIEDDNQSIIAGSTIIDVSLDLEDGHSILYVENGQGRTALMNAIKNRAGWQVVDALLSCEGIQNIIFDKDENGKNILHLAIEEECYDPAVVLSILKAEPECVKLPNEEGILPIEVACMGGAQTEVIMAIALIDLPIDLDKNADENNVRAGYGGSWWYLTCDCDDAFVFIVKDLLEICDHKQKRDLCFLKSRHGESVMNRATPQIKDVLRKALRFAERYEFIGGANPRQHGIKVFEALDFGTDDEPIIEGQKVFLEYHSQEESYERATAVLRTIDLSNDILVHMHFFRINSIDSNQNHGSHQYCIAMDKPLLTLANIATSMEKKRYRKDPSRLHRHIWKLRKVFNVIGHGINFLHQQGVIHGNIALDTCGKFEDGWKLLNLIGVQNLGEGVMASRMGLSIPPEGIKSRKDQSSTRMNDTLSASPTIDIWAFGKLMFEVVVQKSLIPFDSSETIERQDSRLLKELGNWNEENLRDAVAELEMTGIGHLGIDLISHCLCSREERPQSMQEVMSHGFWNESRVKR